MRLKHFFFILVAWLLVLIVVIGMAVEQKPLLYGLQAMVAGLILYLAFFYRKVVKPMNTIGHGMELLREQDFGSRLLPVKQREADRIVEIFNRMMEQLKEERLRLREQNNFLDLLINASPMGVIILSLDEEISMTNPAVYKLFGYDPADADELKGRFQGKRLDALESPLGEELARIPKDSTVTLRLGNGDIYRCSRLSFLDRGFAHPFILIESITDEVKKAEKKAYEKVIRMIAHEVNNTTAGITSTLDTVLDILEGEEMTDVKEVIQICSERCFVMSNFITRFAEVVKIPEPQLEHRDLNKCVDSGRRFMEMMCADRKIGFRVSCCEAALPVQLDATLFEQVLLNIVKNAIESFPDGEGEVIIRTETGAGGKPCLEIANNGAPIDREQEMMLFTPFFSTKPNGQGIGLIFIREVLMAHHCSFSLKSYPDGYTRFKIQFLTA